MATTVHAKLIAENLSGDALIAMRIFGRILGPQEISKDGIDELIELGLAKNEINLLDGNSVFLLTPLGKKVVKQL